MKTFYLAVTFLNFACLSVLAQGRVNFSSAGPGVNVRFYLEGDLNGSGPITANMPYHADLFWSPGSTTVGVSASDLTNRCYFNQRFSTVASQAGYFTGGSKTISGWASGPIVAQVRVWHVLLPNFSDAYYPWLDASYGVSPLFVITPTVSPASVPYLVGLGNGTTNTLIRVPPVQTNPIVSVYLVNTQQKVKAGSNVTLTGSAFSTFGANPQWLFNNAPIDGATNFWFGITNFGPANVGAYRLVATNVYGSGGSDNYYFQAYTTLGISAGPTIQMNGAIGYPFRIEYQESLSGSGNWQELTTITLTNAIQPYLDTSFNGLSPRFYRGVQLP